MTTRPPHWRVDIYYSGFTTLEIEAADADAAILKGRVEAAYRLSLATMADPDGAMAQLVTTLEPWEECDTAEPMAQKE
ncbi:MAG: hypothetical protein HY680_10790 [Chloroflexi bacterium]|nr:hypothetical protein [Chloroflexota bacterium]